MDLQRHILDVARRQLVDFGYERLSMRRIAREIGISATSIYLYYASKDALFEALVDEGMERLFQQLTADRDIAEHPADAFGRVCRSYIAFGLANPEYYEIMFVLRSRAMSRFPAEKYRRARRNLDVMREVIARASGASDEQTLIMATSAWASLHGLVSLIVARRVDARLAVDPLIDRTVERLASDLLRAPHAVEHHESADTGT